MNKSMIRVALGQSRNAGAEFAVNPSERLANNQLRASVSQLGAIRAIHCGKGKP